MKASVLQVRWKTWTGGQKTANMGIQCPERPCPTRVSCPTRNEPSRSDLKVQLVVLCAARVEV